MDCFVQACGQASSSSAAAELLQLAGWWRPHEQISLLKSARTEVFPDAAQVSVPSPVCIPCHPLSHTDFKVHHTAYRQFCCCVLPQTSTFVSCLIARALSYLHALTKLKSLCREAFQPCYEAWWRGGLGNALDIGQRRPIPTHKAVPATQAASLLSLHS